MRPETAAQARERILRDTLARTDLQTALRALKRCRERLEKKR